MKIFVDSKRQLNYHPLVVYFILQQKDYDLHARNIKQLNKYVGFTRGIFKFRAIARGNEYSHVLTPDLTDTINRFNVILRLVDDKDGNYNYALGRMNFNQSPDLFELSLQKYIVGACKQNVKNLQAQLTGYAGNSEDGFENVSAITTMVQGFNDAINIKTFKHGVWQQIVNPAESIPVRVETPFSKSIRREVFNEEAGEALYQHNFNYIHPYELARLKKSVYHSLTDKKAKDEFDKIMTYYASLENVPSIEESDMYVQGTVDDSKSKELRADYGSRTKQGDGSNITIYIKKVSPEKFRKNPRKEWGVEIDVNGTVIQVYMGSTAATMVYISALLKRKMGTCLYRNVFKRPLPSKKSLVNRHEDVVWLNRVYRTLYPGVNVDFDTWYGNMKGNSCHYINVGISKTKSVVEKCLINHSSAIYYCELKKGKDNGSVFYYFNIPVDQIIISDELESLLT